MKSKKYIVRSSKILGGTPVFAGTRVPVKTLIDYLENGDSLDDFLSDFPSVGRRNATGVLELLKKKPELSVIDIAEELKVNFKTISEHIRRLAIAGLVLKRSDGVSIRHKLSSLGVNVLEFLRTIE